MRFVDCYAAPIPTAKRAEYEAHCREAAEVFKEYGALRAADCWGTDIPAGKVTSFSKAVKAKKRETICFGWVEWPSKEVRDEAMPKVMADKRMAMANMPFDGMRLIFGGFELFSDH